MEILRKLLRRRSVKPVETPRAARSALCSGCYQVVPESGMKVIPCFNVDVDKFVTTYRCGACCMEALDDTLLRLAHTVDEGHISSVAEFFQSHGVVVLEYRRGDSPAVVRTLLLELLGKLRSGSLTLSIGQTLPLSPELIEVLSASPLTQD